MAGKPFDSELFAAISQSATFTPIVTLATLHAMAMGGAREQEGTADFALGEALTALHLWRCGVLPLIYPLLIGPEVPSASDARASDWVPLLGSEAFREARGALSPLPHAPTLALVDALCQRHPNIPPLAPELRAASVRDLVCGPYGGAGPSVRDGCAAAAATVGLLSFDACLLMGPTRDLDLHIRNRFAAHMRAALQRAAAEAGERCDDGGAAAPLALAPARPGVARLVAEAAPEALIPWAQLSLGAPLGQGAFGTVHAARWGDTPVALKLLSLVAPPRHVLRQLQREGYIMASVRHPHVCACFGLVVDPPRYGLVLELCAGGTLCDALLDEAGEDEGARAARSLPQRCRWGAQLAAGMAYLHALHPPLGPIIHGDLKSANLLLQQPGNVLKIGGACTAAHPCLRVFACPPASVLTWLPAGCRLRHRLRAGQTARADLHQRHGRHRRAGRWRRVHRRLDRAGGAGRVRRAADARLRHVRLRHGAVGAGGAAAAVAPTHRRRSDRPCESTRAAPAAAQRLPSRAGRAHRALLGAGAAGAAGQLRRRGARPGGACGGGGGALLRACRCRCLLRRAACGAPPRAGAPAAPRLLLRCGRW
jgi:hypothetical protein